jgi:hypothetical protein
MTSEDRNEVAVKGFFLGLLLLASTLINLLVNKDIEHLQIVGSFLVPIILGYCLVGIFIRWLVYRSTIRTEGFNLFSGPSIVYWIWMLSAVFMAGAYFIPQVIRYIVLANLGTLLLVWFLNCVYLKKVAKELNSGLQHYSRTLVEDLTSKPENEDVFMEEINSYCESNHLSLEILEYGVPSKIKMNNALYKVELGLYYDLVGNIVYTLEFHNLASKSVNTANEEI